MYHPTTKIKVWFHPYQESTTKFVSDTLEDAAALEAKYLDHAIDCLEGSIDTLNIPGHTKCISVSSTMVAGIDICADTDEDISNREHAFMKALAREPWESLFSPDDEIAREGYWMVQVKVKFGTSRKKFKRYAKTLDEAREIAEQYTIEACTLEEHPSVVMVGNTLIRMGDLQAITAKIVPVQLPYWMQQSNYTYFRDIERYGFPISSDCNSLYDEDDD